MPTGDAQRVWFPEMLDRLEQIDFDRNDWRAVAEFCSEMTVFRSGLQQAKGIAEPVMKCLHCDSKAVLFNGISIRSYLFALRKRKMVSDSELQRLDRSWSHYRRAHHKDKFGRPIELKRVDKHNRADNH